METIRRDTNMIILQGKVKLEPKYIELQGSHKLTLMLESVTNLNSKEVNYCYTQVEILGEDAKYLSPLGEGRLKVGDEVLLEGLLSSAEEDSIGNVIKHVSNINILGRVDKKSPYQPN